MPEKPLSISIARQWEMLKMLPTRGAGRNAKSIQEELVNAGFKVSLHQVQKDLSGLMGIFPIKYITHENDKAWYWLWTEGKWLNLPGLTVSEAVSLSLVEKTLKPQLPRSMLKPLQQHFLQAAEKLKAIEHLNREAQMARKVRAVPQTLQRLAPAVDPKVLEQAQSALAADEQIDVRYRSIGTQTDTTERLPMRRLHPLGLVQRGLVTYLVATENAHAEVRTYALHRMRGAARTYESTIRPDGFVLDEYIKSNAPFFGGGNPIVLKARVSEDLARILEETPLSAKQSLSKPESMSSRTMLEAEVQNSWTLRWWVLSQGEKIEVVAPVSLRKDVANTLSAAAAQYK